MRLLVLAAATALSLAACKNNDQHDNTMNVDENLTAENIVSNDVTAIDAVTGDASNMAADVNYTNVDENVGTEPEPGAPANVPPPRPNRTATPPAKPTTNTATDADAAAANAAE